MMLHDMVIVLSRPQEAGNVGAVCRAMKNMGLSKLRIVCPGHLDPEVIRARAVHAGDLWETTRVFTDLPQATADCSLVVGTTRRRGQRRKPVSLSPEALGEYLRDKPGKAALVFGNERTGLEAEELAFCNLASHIPADAVFPSLNLSHAVQVYGYTLFRALGPVSAVEGTWVPLDQAGINRLVCSITDSLETLGFYKQPGREEQERFFRDVFARAGLSRREADYIKNLFSKAAHLGEKRKKEQHPEA
ncbi:MAG: RNA methyltransferase [Treponema sp.]|jgi:tRNA/rRNA methyltransferase/tRNA (cytidine32/uridine32-2'-O)-methyltransferase|nr:RNA methyltransferase [Treponema sp.]